MADLNMPAAYDTEPHPYLHEPILYISGLPSYVTDDEIALVFQPCAKFRLKINREEPLQELCGTIEFQYLDRGHFHSIPLQIFAPIDWLTLTSLQLRKHSRVFILSSSLVLTLLRTSSYRHILRPILPHPCRPPQLLRVSSNSSQVTIPISSFTISSDHMVRWLLLEYVSPSRKKPQ